MIRNDASRREKLVLGRRGVSVRLRRETVVTTSRSRDQEGRKELERWRVASGQSGGRGDSENTAPGI
jgi:hypothetical protein